MWRRWSYIRQFKLNFLRFVRLRGAPDEIAKGIGLGIFIGMTPTFGFQMILAVFFALLLKENKLAAVLGVWISNPLTAPFIYVIEYESGRVLLGMERTILPQDFTVSSFKCLGHEVLVPLCLGSLIYGLLFAGLAYALALRAVPVVKTWHIPRWPRSSKKF